VTDRLRLWTDALEVRDDEPASPADIGAGLLVALGFLVFLLALLVVPVIKAGERFR
jgi:hypothetical protein